MPAAATSADAAASIDTVAEASGATPLVWMPKAAAFSAKRPQTMARQTVADVAAAAAGRDTPKAAAAAPSLTDPGASSEQPAGTRVVEVEAWEVQDDVNKNEDDEMGEVADEDDEVALVNRQSGGEDDDEEVLEAVGVW